MSLMKLQCRFKERGQPSGSISIRPRNRREALVRVSQRIHSPLHKISIWHFERSCFGENNDKVRPASSWLILHSPADKALDYPALESIAGLDGVKNGSSRWVSSATPAIAASGRHAR